MDEVTKTEKKRSESVALFEKLGLQALRVVHHVLTLPNDRDSFDSDTAHHRRLRLQANAARSFLANAIKVDGTRFQAQQHEDWLEAFNKKLAEAEAKLKTKQERISKE